MKKAWTAMTASELGRAMDAGKVNPVELAEAYLDSAARHPDAARIFARIMPNRARTEAMAAAGRQKAGLRKGLLDGVPICWKDLFDTAGRETEAGSALLKGRIPDTDAEVLARTTRAGLVCLGKTHMSELAFSGLGLNPVTATPPNVNDPAAAPGGSSSGTAAAIAFGLSPAGIGTDTGGSVRIPAAWNDLVGLKTTAGRLPLTGVVPLAERFDTVGPLARSVEDCAELLAVLDGSAAPDLRGASMAGVRLMVLETVALEDVRARPMAGFDSACARIERAGARLIRRKLPEVAEAMAMSAILFTAEAWGIWGNTITANPDVMFAPIRERFQSGASFLAADYIAAWRRLETLRGIWARETAGFDAVILPTAPNVPPDVARLLSDPGYYVTENLATLRNTRIGNLFGLCGLTLPTPEPSCGVMFLAPPMAEARLLRLGAAAEHALR